MLDDCIHEDKETVQHLALHLYSSVNEPDFSSREVNIQKQRLGKCFAKQVMKRGDTEA